MNQRTRILFLDGDCGDTQAAIDRLVASGMDVDACCAGDRGAFDECLARSDFDVIVCEISVAGLESAAAVERARAAQPEVPVVVLSNALDERTAVACMKAGAADYVLKQHMERLVYAIPRAIAEARGRQRRRGAEEQLNRVRSALLAHAENSSDVVWICEADPPVVTYASPAVRRWGLTPEDLERDASAWLQRLHPDDRDAITEEYERWLASDSVEFEQECRFRAPGQEILWVLLRGAAVRGVDGALQSCSWTATDITTQKNSEEWIRENEERFRAVFNSSFQYMALLDVTGRVIAANSTMTRGIDEPADAVVGAAYSELAIWGGFGDEQAALQAAVAAAARGHTTQLDIHERRPNGEIGNLEVSISPIQDDAGTVTEILAEARDKTLEYRSERAFAFLNGLSPGDGDFFVESSRAMAETLDCEFAFVATLDTDDSQRAMLRALWHDGAAQPLHGFRVPGTAMADPGVAELLLVPQDLAGEYPDADFPAADLGMHSAAIAPLRGTEGEVIGFAGVLRRRPMAGDTKTILPIFAIRIAAELERRAGEAKFQSLFEFAPVALLLADRDGRIRTANQQASVLLLHSPAELRRMSLEDLAPTTADASHPLIAAGATKQFGPEPRTSRGGHPPLFVRTGGGAEIPAEITVSPLELDGRTALVAAIHDVSARVAAEEALAHVQKMDAVGKITGGVAHDFNNHLSVIVGNLDLIALEAGNNPRIGKLIESATAAIERSSLLTRQLLAFARLQPWSCPAYVPVFRFIYAAFRSNAKGLLLPSDEWRRREL